MRMISAQIALHSVQLPLEILRFRRSFKRMLRGQILELAEWRSINCSSAAIQNETTYFLSYKIVFNLWVATGASYGVFKTSMLTFNWGLSVLLMIKKPKTLRVVWIIITFLSCLASVIPSFLMTHPIGAAFLLNNLVVILKIIIILAYSLIFLWRILWNSWIY